MTQIVNTKVVKVTEFLIGMKPDEPIFNVFVEGEYKMQITESQLRLLVKSANEAIEMNEF